jgi:paraquat-inducible protein A
MKYLTASSAGFVSCRACGRVQPFVRSLTRPRCVRCGAALHRRKPDSLARTWALLIAAALLYIPANLLPVMHTASLLGDEDDTIMSGIVYFWTSGDWPLAIIVFIASILVPMLKLIVLALLVISSHQDSGWRPIERTRLYRLIEFIGRWSMLDVFVITLTVALVRFQSVAVITAGPGAIAFGSVVVLTMLASLQFDPRLIWDPLNRKEAGREPAGGNPPGSGPDGPGNGACYAQPPATPPHQKQQEAPQSATQQARQQAPHAQDRPHE